METLITVDGGPPALAQPSDETDNVPGGRVMGQRALEEVHYESERSQNNRYGHLPL